MSDLKKFNPLFWKMEKGKIVENKGPMLYSKVIWNKKKNSIQTIFVDEDTNEEVNPMELLNKPCYVTAAIKFESIFVGNKVSLQVKLFETVFKIKETSVRGLLRPDAVKRSEEISYQESSSSAVPTFTEEVEEEVEEVEEEDDDEIEIEEEESIPVQLNTKPSVSETKTETKTIPANTETSPAIPATPVKRGRGKK